MFCPVCGKKAVDGKKFCAGCGSPLVNAKTEQPRQKREEAEIAPRKIVQNESGEANRKSIGNLRSSVKNKKSEETDNAKKTPASIAVSILTMMALTLRTILFPRMGAHRRTRLALPGLIFVILLFIVVAAMQRCDKNLPAGNQPANSGSDETYAPEGFRFLDVSVSDEENSSVIEIKILITNAKPDEKTMQAALLEMHGKWIHRINVYRKFQSTQMTIRIYASESDSRHDPEWWVARLYWAKGDKKPVIEYQMDALLPRHTVMGYSGLPREVYIEQADKVANDLYAAAKEIRDLLKQYEEMAIEDAAFKEKARKQADALAVAIETIPEPPWNDCVKLDEIFLRLVDSSYYFQELFGPDSNLFSGRRLNTTELADELKYFFDTFNEFRVERSKY